MDENLDGEGETLTFHMNAVEEKPTNDGSSKNLSPEERRLAWHLEKQNTKEHLAIGNT